MNGKTNVKEKRIEPTFRRARKSHERQRSTWDGERKGEERRQ
jgi:hypothetical protein